MLDTCGRVHRGLLGEALRPQCFRRNFPVTCRVGICASFELYDTEAEEVKMKLRRAEREGRLRSEKR